MHMYGSKNVEWRKPMFLLMTVLYTITGAILLFFGTIAEGLRAIF